MVSALPAHNRRNLPMVGYPSVTAFSIITLIYRDRGELKSFSVKLSRTGSPPRPFIV
jgi:hypothetical protein